MKYPPEKVKALVQRLEDMGMWMWDPMFPNDKDRISSGGVRNMCSLHLNFVQVAEGARGRHGGPNPQVP
jgi:hypothetical protein